MKIYLDKNDVISKVTKKAFSDFNRMNDMQFMRKYSCSKKKYLKRVMKYGDPYMRSPLAKIGKYLSVITKIK